MLAHLKIEKNINMARELPLPPIMANAIQNFHLVFWTFFLVLPPSTVNWTILAPAAAEPMETEASSEPAASSAEAPKEASPVKVWLCSFLPWTSHKKFISPMRNESRTIIECLLPMQCLNVTFSGERRWCWSWRRVKMWLFQAFGEFWLFIWKQYCKHPVRWEPSICPGENKPVILVHRFQ